MQLGAAMLESQDVSVTWAEEADRACALFLVVSRAVCGCTSLSTWRNWPTQNELSGIFVDVLFYFGHFFVIFVVYLLVLIFIFVDFFLKRRTYS